MVKALDLKSNGVSPRRFESCRMRCIAFILMSDKKHLQFDLFARRVNSVLKQVSSTAKEKLIPCYVRKENLTFSLHKHEEKLKTSFWQLTLKEKEKEKREKACRSTAQNDRRTASPTHPMSGNPATDDMVKPERSISTTAREEHRHTYNAKSITES